VLRLEIQDRIGVIQVDRVEKANALNTATWVAIEAAVEELDANKEIIGVVLTGTGDRVFIAGSDVEELATRRPTENLAARSQRVATRLENMSVPTVAAINGHALGGGLELALACDFRVASKDAVLGQPEVKLGIIPGAGGTQRLTRLVGYGRALEMIVTGEAISADEALRIGLVNRVCSPGEVHDVAFRLLTAISENGRLAVRLAREVLRFASSPLGQAGFTLERLASVIAYTDPERKRRMTDFLSGKRVETPD
jgi:enoyl-CoA hydratase